MIASDDDTAVSPLNAVGYYEALHRAGVSAELHVYRQGKHGFGIRGTHGLAVADWPRLTVRWLQSLGLVPVARE